MFPLPEERKEGLTVQVYAPVAGFEPESHFSALELRRQDPYTTFGLAAVREAVSQSGVLGEVDPFRLGVYLTSGLGGATTVVNEYETLQRTGPRRVSPMLIPKWTTNILAGMAAIELGAHGPSLAHVSACASSAMSIGEGTRAIRHGYADAMVCGGAEMLGTRLAMAGFQNLRALTPVGDPDRASLPFDRTRAGFVMGEGGAAVDRAISDALAEAGPTSGTVHINAHGTGTVKNDRVESRAISRAFGPQSPVTSTKSMTGHLMGAAGALETIASVLALLRDEVPPTVGTSELDPHIDIDVVLKASRKTKLARAVSLSLGFGGHNACLILEKAT